MIHSEADMRIALATFLLFVLAACSSAQPSSTAPQPASVQDALGKISQFTVADLQAADADAVAHNDAIAHACYPPLIKFVQSLQGPNGTVAGAFSAFQAARDIRLGVQSGLPVDLKLGCSALVQDETQLLIKLGLIGAGASTLAPLAPVLLP